MILFQLQGEETFSTFNTDEECSVYNQEPSVLEFLFGKPVNRAEACISNGCWLQLDQNLLIDKSMCTSCVPNGGLTLYPSGCCTGNPKMTIDTHFGYPVYQCLSETSEDIAALPDIQQEFGKTTKDILGDLLEGKSTETASYIGLFLLIMLTVIIIGVAF
jgi:hypothetical protein